MYPHPKKQLQRLFDFSNRLTRSVFFSFRLSSQLPTTPTHRSHLPIIFCESAEGDEMSSAPPTTFQQQADAAVGCNVISQNSLDRYHMDAKKTAPQPCGAIPVQLPEVIEIATSGTRAPINFVEKPSFCGRSCHPSSTHDAPSHSNAAAPGAVVQQTTSTSVSRSSKTHHRRTSSAPLDGVWLTLLGVSSGLKTPGVDHWAVARALVESSVDLRTRNARGMTPLHLACAAGQVR